MLFRSQPNILIVMKNIIYLFSSQNLFSSETSNLNNLIESAIIQSCPSPLLFLNKSGAWTKQVKVISNQFECLVRLCLN